MGTYCQEEKKKHSIIPRSSVFAVFYETIRNIAYPYRQGNKSHQPPEINNMAYWGLGIFFLPESASYTLNGNDWPTTTRAEPTAWRLLCRITGLVRQVALVSTKRILFVISSGRSASPVGRSVADEDNTQLHLHFCSGFGSGTFGINESKNLPLEKHDNIRCISSGGVSRMVAARHVLCFARSGQSLIAWPMRWCAGR